MTLAVTTGLWVRMSRSTEEEPEHAVLRQGNAKLNTTWVGDSKASGNRPKTKEESRKAQGGWPGPGPPRAGMIWVRAQGGPLGEPHILGRNPRVETSIPGAVT